MASDPTGPSAGELAAAAMLRADATAARLGIEILTLTEGRCSAQMLVTADMLNGHGTCHGGYLFLLADTAFAGACNSSAGGAAAVASSCEITYVAPARQGDLLLAEASQRVAFGRSALADVTVRRRDGTVLAEFRGHSRTLRDAP